MRSPLFSALLACFLLLCGNCVHSANISYASYANVFVNPDYIVARQLPNTTLAAQQTIISWAQELAGEGPWSARNLLYFNACH